MQRGYTQGRGRRSRNWTTVPVLLVVPDEWCLCAEVLLLASLAVAVAVHLPWRLGTYLRHPQDCGRGPEELMSREDRRVGVRAQSALGTVSYGI